MHACRYLTDAVPRLPMGLMTRLTTTHDIPMALVALLDDAPWIRRKGKVREGKDLLGF